LLFFAVPFKEQLIAFGSDRSCLARRQLVCADEIGKFFPIDFSDRRIFVVAMCLTGDDLPITVAFQPRVGDVITCF